MTRNLNEDTVCYYLNKMIKKLVLCNTDELTVYKTLQFINVFSNIVHLYLNIRTIDEFCIITPLLLEKLVKLEDLQIQMIDSNYNFDAWLRANTVLENFTYQRDEYTLQIWK
ncbi:unnamed protein product [Didymodactylos carnosus]|nr:unnamed protein product [Didymodactylos carnosus]CAF3868403.1 unnamed protein product [Didymodactylos carnosus]